MQLIPLLFLLLLSSAKCRVQYYEADQLATEGGDWSVKFVPRIGHRVSNITWEFQNKTVIFCEYTGSKDGPVLNSYFKCPKGCLYEQCQAFDSYGIRIEENIFRLFAFKATSAMIGDYKITVTFIGKHYNFTSVSTLVKSSPSLLHLTSLVSNVPQITEALKSPSAAVLDKQNLDNLNSTLKFIHEGIFIKGSIKVNLGLPAGVIGIYLVRQPRNTHYPYYEPCEISSNASLHNFSCQPSIDDFAMGIFIANSVNASISNEQALGLLKDWVMKRLVLWRFDMPYVDTPAAPETVFGRDYRVIPLKIGWSAVIEAGEKVEIYCPLVKHASPRAINCFRSRALYFDTIDTTLPSGFWVEYFEGNKFFYLRKNSTDTSDSGVYGCTVKVNGYPQPVCSDRRLYVIGNVIPVRTLLYKDLVPTEDLEPTDRFEQFTEDKVPFLLTTQKAYILCWTETDTKYDYTLSLSLLKEDGNDTTEFPFNLTNTYILREGTHIIRIFKFYSISGEGNVNNGGKLRAYCSTSYEEMERSIPEWIIDPNDVNENAELGRVAANLRYIHMYHPTEGDLKFHGTVDRLDEYPVPLGTVIRCSGANGYPKPVYKWTAIDPTQFSTGFIGMSRVSKIFLDSPHGLPKSAFQGEQLKIPNDPKYKGMSYLLKCTASNKFAGHEFTSQRVVFLSICLCDIRFVQLDLSLILSPQIVAGISLVDSDNERSTLDIYGERYVHLLQQIILGLGYGEGLVRIGLHPTSVLSRNLREAPLYASVTHFSTKSSRIALAEGLISQIIRPQAIYATDPDACPQKLPVNLKEGFITALRDAPRSSKRPFAVVLPQDRWDVGDVQNFIQNIRKVYGEVISVFFEDDKTWAKGTPNYAIQIANFSSTCQRYSINSRASFIQRLPLFKAICAIAKPAVLYDETLMVAIFSSHQPHQFYSGETVKIFAIIRKTPFDKPPVTSWLCLIDEEEANYIKQGETDLDYLDSVCLQPLLKSKPSNLDSNCIYFELELALKKKLDKKYLLVYKRGVKNTLSSQEVAILPIRLNRGEFSKPTLRLKSPAVKAMDSAEFECEFVMPHLKFQVYLIYQPPNNDTYVIITQKTSMDLEYSYRNIGHNVTVPLIWPFFPAEAADREIYCAVSQIGQFKDNLYDLPPLVSEPIYHNLSAICPMRPTIERLVFPPKTNLTEGSRVTFICEAVTGQDHMHALQMSYIESSVDMIICSNRGGGKVNISVPCMFSPFRDSGCWSHEKVLSDIHPKGAFANCSISHRERDGAYIRRIEYTIPVITVRHFESFLFCETIPTWEVEEESRLLSDPIDNLFPVGPRVTYIRVGYYQWQCGVLAYPEPINASWAPLEASPETFASGLRRFQFTKDLAASVRHRGYLVSMSYFPMKFRRPDWRTPYEFTLKWPAPYVFQVGLFGKAKFVCYVVGPNNKTAYEEAVIMYGFGSSNGGWTASGSIEPDLGVVNPDDPWTIKCPLREIAENAEVFFHVFLLAQVKAPSIEPLEIPLLHLTIYKPKNDSSRINHLKLLGWWSFGRGREFDISLTKGHQDNQVVKIDLPKAFMHDTGRYMCRFHVDSVYYDAPVVPDLVVPADKQSPIIGYLAENRSWEFSDSYSRYLTFFDDEYFTSQCLIWRFQNPYETYFTKPLIAESTKRNPNMAKITKSPTILTEKTIFQHYSFYTVNISWHLNVHFDYDKHVGCYWNLDTKEERELGEKFGPLKICAPTESLKTRPDPNEPMARDGVIECYDDGEIYHEHEFTWVYRFGPLPRLNDSVEVSGIPRIIKSSKLDLYLLPMPGFYIYKCVASSFCGGKKMVSEKTIQFVVVGDEKAPAFTTVSISKRMILLPEKFTVECPSILSEGSYLTALNLTWFRINRPANTVSPHLNKFAKILSYHDLINNTVNISHPSLVAYHFGRRNREVFAIDIQSSSFEDYGFYGCTIGALRPVGEVRNLSLSQVSEYPICIVDNHADVQIVTKPDQSDDCYTEGEVINVYCQATVFQIFCDEEDKPVGSRFVETDATVHITSGNFDKSSPLRLFSFRILEWKPPIKTVQYAPVPITITRSHHNAKLSCLIEPKLLNVSLVNRNEWQRIRAKIIRRASRKLCVFSPASDYIIIPTPPEQVSMTKVAFKIESGEWVTCIASGNPPPTVTLDAYPMRRGALADAMRLGLEGIENWRDYSRAQPDWPSAPLKNDTGSMLMVLKELNDPPDVTYFGVCRGTNRVNKTEVTTYKTFIFRIRETRGFTSTATFNHFLIIAFMMALLIYVLGTFIHELLVLRHRHRRLKKE
ncbi:unnamed protein product [Rodentolepis nana]|uniref:Ig-like domain-containing protein n=1 Tax=Rodentolepis nana TaxID=102285 RepID=A0A0R3TSL2_RODNA|nr:unnamed protein product [Rodentolepis nana]